MVQRDRYIVSLKREEERLEKRLKKLEMKQKEMRQKKHTLFETRLRLAAQAGGPSRLSAGFLPGEWDQL